MAGAVLDGGGEVLRYIGDAVLAIFPIHLETATYSKTCNQAADAARDAVARMAKVNFEQVASGFTWATSCTAISVHPTALHFAS